MLLNNNVVAHTVTRSVSTTLVLILFKSMLTTGILNTFPYTTQTASQHGPISFHRGFWLALLGQDSFAGTKQEPAWHPAYDSTVSRQHVCSQDPLSARVLPARPRCPRGMSKNKPSLT